MQTYPAEDLFHQWQQWWWYISLPQRVRPSLVAPVRVDVTAWNAYRAARASSPTPALDLLSWRVNAADLAGGVLPDLVGSQDLELEGVTSIVPGGSGPAYVAIPEGEAASIADGHTLEPGSGSMTVLLVASFDDDPVSLSAVMGQANSGATGWSILRTSTGVMRLTVNSGTGVSVDSAATTAGDRLVIWGRRDADNDLIRLRVNGTDSTAVDSSGDAGSLDTANAFTIGEAPNGGLVQPGMRLFYAGYTSTHLTDNQLDQADGELDLLGF